nr:hypothetical protein [Vibrio alginolyticus]
MPASITAKPSNSIKVNGTQKNWMLFLASPPEFAPGTNMVFPGVKDPGARAAIIAWLATQNPTPPDWNTVSSEVEVKSAGDGILAPGENMELVAAVCSACHSLHMITQQ